MMINCAWLGKLACAFVVAATLAASPAAAQFQGNLVLLPEGCQATGLCELGEAFGFIDPKGVGWEARKGLLTDGASIPLWAQPIVGKPFAEAFIKAAVVHDHYCDRHVRSWRMTHRVFYDALRASGVPKGKAGLMYFGVLIGGPKWSKLIPGKPCAVGVTCINKVEMGASVAGAGITLGEEGAPYISRPDMYGSHIFAAKMAEHGAILDALGDNVEPSDVEAEAARAMANDFFFVNGDEVGTTLRLFAPAM